MLSQDLLDALVADRQREMEQNLKVRSLLGRPHRARSVRGMARRLRQTMEVIRRR